MFHALHCINDVKSVGFINLFLLSYRAPPELIEFWKRHWFRLFLIKHNIILAEKASLRSSFEVLDAREK